MRQALAVVAHRLRCPTACGILSAAVAAGLSLLSHVQLFATPWSVAHQAPLSMGFPRQEYWRGLPLPSLGDLLDPEIKPVSPVWVLHHSATWEAQSPQTRDQTHVPCIGRWILKYWTLSTGQGSPAYLLYFIFGYAVSLLQHVAFSCGEGSGVRGFSGYGLLASLAIGLRLSCPGACGVLVPQPGIKPSMGRQILPY